MLDYARRVAGYIEVYEKDALIYIRGINTEALKHGILRNWRTSKIASNMFVYSKGSAIAIPAFFGIELSYILKELAEQKVAGLSRRVIERILYELNTKTWLGRIEAPVQPWMDYKAAEAFIWPLLPHQVQFLKTYETSSVQYGLKGMLLHGAPGSGKTLTNIAFALAVKATKVLIISPALALTNVWVDTLVNKMKTPRSHYVSNVDGENLKPNEMFHIFSYERLEYAINLLDKWNLDKENIVIILDESHNFNRLEAQRTERFITLCHKSKSKHIIWASGTPIKALGTETVPILRTIDPLFTPNVEVAYRKLFGRDATRALDILSHRLGLVRYIVPKTTVRPDKPIEEIMSIRLPNGSDYTLEKIGKDMGDYIQERMAVLTEQRPIVAKEFFETLDHYRLTKLNNPNDPEFQTYLRAVKTLYKSDKFQRGDAPLAVLTNKYEKEKILPTLVDGKARQKFISDKAIVKYPDLKARGECLGLILTKARINCNVDMINAINFNELIDTALKKTIFFTSYVKVADACVARLNTLKYKPLVVYGDTNKDLTNIIGKFTNDPTINPLVATFQSLSTAVPITIANHVVMLNNPWRVHDREQAISRADRLGQDQQVYVTDIILDTGTVPNISSRSLDVMEWSKQQVAKIMGSDADLAVSLEDDAVSQSVETEIVETIIEECEETLMSQMQTQDQPLPLIDVNQPLPTASFEQLHTTVSIEMSNPIATITNFTLKKFGEFIAGFKKESDTNLRQLAGIGSTDSASSIDFVNAIKTKQVSYSDIGPVKVFVPANLAPNAKMLAYSEFIQLSLSRAAGIVLYSGEECLNTLNTYLGNPDKLKDVLTPIKTTEHAHTRVEQLADLNKMWAKLSNGKTNNPTERPFNQAYARLEDYVQLQNGIETVMVKRALLVAKLPEFNRKVTEIKEVSDRLLYLLSSNPEKYTMGSVAGQRLVELLYVFAKEVEFVGATIYTTDTYLKAVRDTSFKLDRIIKN